MLRSSSRRGRCDVKKAMLLGAILTMGCGAAAIPSRESKDAGEEQLDDAGNVSSSDVGADSSLRDDAVSSVDGAVDSVTDYSISESGSASEDLTLTVFCHDGDRFRGGTCTDGAKILNVVPNGASCSWPKSDAGRNETIVIVCSSF